MKWMTVNDMNMKLNGSDMKLNGITWNTINEWMRWHIMKLIENEMNEWMKWS